MFFGIKTFTARRARFHQKNRFGSLGREQFVELNDTASKTLPIVTGVPQSSISGPLLFCNIYK